MTLEPRQSKIARCDYGELRQHLEAGRPWLDPMTWQLVDDAEVEIESLRQVLREIRDRLHGYYEISAPVPPDIEYVYEAITGALGRLEARP